MTVSIASLHRGTHERGGNSQDSLSKSFERWGKLHRQANYTYCTRPSFLIWRTNFFLNYYKYMIDSFFFHDNKTQMYISAYVNFILLSILSFLIRRQNCMMSTLLFNRIYSKFSSRLFPFSSNPNPLMWLFNCTQLTSTYITIFFLKRGQSRVKVSYSPPSPHIWTPYFSDSYTAKK